MDDSITAQEMFAQILQHFSKELARQSAESLRQSRDVGIQMQRVTEQVNLSNQFSKALFESEVEVNELKEQLATQIKGD